MFEENLIEAVKRNRCLYSKGSRGNTINKKLAWEKISADLGETVFFCMTRWKSLRDRFVRECHAGGKRKNLLTWSASDTVRSSKDWEYFDSLMFLRDHFQPRKSRVKRSSRRSSGSVAETVSLVKTEIEIVDVKGALDSSENWISVNPLEEIPSESGSGRRSSTRNSMLPDESASMRSDSNSDHLRHKIEFMMDYIKNYMDKPTIKDNPFIQRVAVLMQGLKPDEQEKAEKRIVTYLCKCQLASFADEDISTVKM